MAEEDNQCSVTACWGCSLDASQILYPSPLLVDCALTCVVHYPKPGLGSVNPEYFCFYSPLRMAISLVSCCYIFIYEDI